MNEIEYYNKYLNYAKSVAIFCGGLATGILTAVVVLAVVGAYVTT